MPDPIPAPAPAPAPVPAPAGGGAPPGPSPAQAAPPPNPAAGPGGAPAPAPAPTGTLGSGNIDPTPTPGTPPAPPAPATFPENWRQQLAGEDKSKLKTLERFNSPVDVFKAYEQLRADVDGGKFKAPANKPPENATAEQLAEWRKTAGLPETPEAIVAGIKLGEGRAIGEADKPLVSDFAAAAHKNGWSQESVNQALDWYYANAETQIAARQQQDVVVHNGTIDLFRAEWGQDYKRNSSAIDTFATFTFGADKAALLSARLEDGTMVGDHPGLCRAMAMAGRDLAGVDKLVPPGTQDAAKAVASEKIEIEKQMGDPRSDYNRGPKSQGLKARYREILEAEQADAARRAKR